MMRKFTTYIIFTVLLFTSCIGEEDYTNSGQGVFEALWKTMDRRYCFFEIAEKNYGLDWNEVHDRYEALVDTCTSDASLFDVLGDMLKELRDGHVNLSSMYGTSYYWDWKQDYPANFSDSIQRNYLGNDFRLTNGIKYTELSDSIGYAYVGSFSSSFGINNLSMMLINLKGCKGLILDIRDNGGGLITAAERLASPFTDKKVHCGYMMHKTGTGHNDFSEPEKIYLDPSPGAIWLRPVVVLTNRGVYSAANHFVMLMRELPYVTVMGDKTGGGSGMPFTTTLPNGWSVRFSACPTLDAQGKDTEFGIDPDIPVQITSEDWNNGRDTMIESAKKHILDFYAKKAGI